MPIFPARKKELIVTIHGFGTQASKEMQPLCAFLKKEGYRCISFDIFNPNDPEDIDVKTWIHRCESQMRQAFKHHENVILIGFSMGGVIASYLASIFPVKQLILVAPAFNYMDLSKIEKAGKGMLSSSSKKAEMSFAQKQAFMNVVSSYRGSIAMVDCPVLFLHGTADEVIPPKSSRKAYFAVPHDQKRLYFLEGARHRVLYDGKMEKAAFALILDMLQGRLL